MTDLTRRMLLCSIGGGLSSLPGIPAALAASGCAPAVRPDGMGMRLRTDGAPLRRLGPAFFGFNIEQTELEYSLWQGRERRVAESALAVIAEFPGAIHRFPGGTTANHIRAPELMGPVRDRTVATPVDWDKPRRLDFGIPEYLAFVQSVQGLPWYVLNLFGNVGKMQDIDVLAEEAGALARSLRDSRPAIHRWELGNELDRGTYMWKPDFYVRRAEAVQAAVLGELPEARFVGMFEDWGEHEADGISRLQYNRTVASRLGRHGVGEWAQHYYYDDPPFGPSIPFRLDQICEADHSARRGAGDDQALAWITEHARWPMEVEGKPWKAVWQRSADLGAALGVADFMIALTQMPWVRGAMVHALHGFVGPWPMFHPEHGAEGAFIPSLPMQALRLLREGLLDDVLATGVASTDRSRYIGGYDGRGAILRSEDGSRLAVWMVNRSGDPLAVRLEIEGMEGATPSSRLRYISGEALSDSHYGGRIRLPLESKRLSLSFDKLGRTVMELPPLSVAVLHCG